MGKILFILTGIFAIFVIGKMIANNLNKPKDNNQSDTILGKDEKKPYEK